MQQRLLRGLLWSNRKHTASAEGRGGWRTPLGPFQEMHSEAVLLLKHARKELRRDCVGKSILFSLLGHMEEVTRGLAPSKIRLRLEFVLRLSCTVDGDQPTLDSQH